MARSIKIRSIKTLYTIALSIMTPDRHVRTLTASLAAVAILAAQILLPAATIPRAADPGQAPAGDSSMAGCTSTCCDSGGGDSGGDDALPGEVEKSAAIPGMPEPCCPDGCQQCDSPCCSGLIMIPVVIIPPAVAEELFSGALVPLGTHLASICPDRVFHPPRGEF